MRRQHAVRGAFLTGLATVVLMLSGITGCRSNPDTEPGGDIADAYAVVVRWFVDNSAPGDNNPLVLIEARGEGLGIGLEAQAALVAASDEFADVRFIDDRAEAMDDEGVRHDVILLAIGPAIAEGTTASIACDQISGPEVVLSWTFSLEFVNDGWRLTSAPQPLG